VAALLFGAFLFVPWPRDLMALAGAGILMTSRRMHSRRMLGLVDWQLLVLFMGLFVVNHALQGTGVPAHAVAALAAAGVDLHEPAPLFAASFVLSNLVSNVPAVMLLLPAATHPLGGTVLALSSTLAGNLFIVGSIANIIVADSDKMSIIRPEQFVESGQEHGLGGQRMNGLDGVRERLDVFQAHPRFRHSCHQVSPLSLQHAHVNVMDIGRNRPRKPVNAGNLPQRLLLGQLQ
jgi:hypothetical protein